MEPHRLLCELRNANDLGPCVFLEWQNYAVLLVMVNLLVSLGKGCRHEWSGF